MADKDAMETWLPVIGNALAFLCLDRYAAKNPDKTDTVLKKVKFLKGLGLPDEHAAGASGSTAESLRVLSARAKGRKRGRK